MLRRSPSDAAAWLVLLLLSSRLAGAWHTSFASYSLEETDAHMRSPWAGSEDTTPAFTSGAGRDWRAARFTPDHYLGHRNIQHTVWYTELAPERFKKFWVD